MVDAELFRLEGVSLDHDALPVSEDVHAHLRRHPQHLSQLVVVLYDWSLAHHGSYPVPMRAAAGDTRSALARPVLCSPHAVKAKDDVLILQIMCIMRIQQ